MSSVSVSAGLECEPCCMTGSWWMRRVGAVRDAVEQYSGKLPARQLCVEFPDLALGSAIDFPRQRDWRQGK